MGGWGAPRSLPEQRVPGMVRDSSAPGDAPSYSAEHRSLRTVRGEQLPPNQLITYRNSTRLTLKKKKLPQTTEHVDLWGTRCSVKTACHPEVSRRWLCLQERSWQFKGGLRDNK